MAGIKGTTFVFTGKVGNLDRGALARRVEALGGCAVMRVADSKGPLADYLVVGDTGPHGQTAKQTDALRWGIEIVSGLAFMDWLNASEREQRAAAHKAHATMRKQKEPPTAGRHRGNTAGSRRIRGFVRQPSVNRSQFSHDLLQVNSGLLPMEHKNIPTASKELLIRRLRELTADNRRLQTKCDNLYALVVTYVDPSEIDAVLNGRRTSSSAIM